MPSKSPPIRNDEYYKGIAVGALDALLATYPASSHPSVVEAYLHCLTDTVIYTLSLDKKLPPPLLQFVNKELATREPPSF